MCSTTPAGTVQQVSLGSHTSTWEKIIRVSPRIQSWGPFFLMFFLNDIFFIIKQGVIYNHADDNTLSYIHANIDVIKKILDEESCNLIDCVFF